MFVAPAFLCPLFSPDWANIRTITQTSCYVAKSSRRLFPMHIPVQNRGRAFYVLHRDQCTVVLHLAIFHGRIAIHSVPFPFSKLLPNPRLCRGPKSSIHIIFRILDSRWGQIAIDGMFCHLFLLCTDKITQITCRRGHRCSFR